MVAFVDRASRPGSLWVIPRGVSDVADRYRFPNVISTLGMITIHTCAQCGASIVQTPGDAIDRQAQHIDWHDQLTEREDQSGR